MNPFRRPKPVILTPFQVACALHTEAELQLMKAEEQLEMAESRVRMLLERRQRLSERKVELEPSYKVTADDPMRNTAQTFDWTDMHNIGNEALQARSKVVEAQR